MAVIIGRSNRTIAEKHQAWQELIDKYPDMSVKSYRGMSFASIHKKLAEIIDYEDQILKLFKKLEPGIVYTYRIRKNNDYHNSEDVFSCYEKALEAVKDSWEPDEVSYINIEKISIDDIKNDKSRISAFFDYDGNLYKLSFYGGNKKLRAKLFANINSNEASGDEFTENFYIDIPTPFKRGDILIGSSSMLGQLGKSRVFVHDGLNRDDPKVLERCFKGIMGDGSDLMGWGFFVNENGVLYGDHTYNHDSFEYYHGELTGNQRLLHYVSLYLKKEITLSEILTIQCRIMLEHQLNNNLPIKSHGCYIPEHLLAQEEKENYNGVKNDL
jgi:Fe-S-cluster formation regulator IscX/YfhJ